MKTGRTMISIALATALFAGCATFPIQSAYESRGPSREASLRVDIGREVDGGRVARVTGGPLLGAVLFGQAAPGTDGGWEVSLASLHWFNNWENGWTDAQFVLDGTIDLVQDGPGWSVRVRSMPEIVAPSSATIHYFDRYLNGDSALEQLSRRWNRIEACATFLRSRFGDTWWENQREVMRFLFPELSGYDQPPDPHHAHVTAESISWNTDYTRKEFPENLRALRDSGTMLRDFEESPGLWALAFHWSDLWNTGIPTRVFSSSTR